MRVRHSTPLLFWLLAPVLVAAVDLSDKPPDSQARLLAQDTGDEILPPKQAPKKSPLVGPEAKDAVLAAATTSTAAAATPTKRYMGTEDAPVDGLDGKPHAGPFVDSGPDEPKKGPLGTTATEKAIPTSLKKLEELGEAGWKLQDIPERNDGVMNDENRQLPKKGTTGNEGGISEKRPARIGEEKEPQSPKEAPPLPHSEEQHIEAAAEKEAERTKSEKAKQTKDGKEAPKDAVTGKVDSVKGSEFGEGGHNLEKPVDLPDKPHDIPHPEPAKSDRNKWVVNDLPDTDGRTNRPSSKSSRSKTAKGDRQHVHDPSDWHEWFHAFVLSLTMIIFSEIGDKTFLVAALMAMRHPRWVVFSSALSALVAMTVLSAVLGHAFPTLLPRRLTTFAAAVLFFVFGAKSLREGLAMPASAGVGEEMKEVEAELEEKEHNMARRRSRAESASALALEAGRGRSGLQMKQELSPPPSRSPSRRRGAEERLAGLTNLMSLVLSPAWVQTFVMTFLGEWGDRSQIATIAMAAGQDYWWVTLGAILGHALCTGLAVLGGRALAGRVSMRVVTIGGAIAFLVFGCIYLYECLVE